MVIEMNDIKKRIDEIEAGGVDEQKKLLEPRRLAELLCGNHLKPVYHGVHGLDVERAGTQLSDHTTKMSRGS